MSENSNCIFCKIVSGESAAVKVYEDSQVIAFMDLMPQADGHVLIIPKTHATAIHDTAPEDLTAVILTTQKIANAVKQAFNADGIFIMQLNGRVAGQSVFHMHFHVIPRHENTELRRHARDMADTGTLEAHASRIREVLGAT